MLHKVSFIARLVSLLIISFCLCGAASSFALQTLIVKKVKKIPLVDGKDEDPVWTNAKEISTHDNVAHIDITLKAVYTDKEIFFLVSFIDSNESRTHKSWNWNKERKIYIIGNDREDVFVIKWSLEKKPIDLSIYADNPYQADIWFWKACRTDPVGYANDKIQTLSKGPMKKATQLESKTGRIMYLLREGDSGKCSFETYLPLYFEKLVIPRFRNRTPTGSRSDIKAKGHWQNNRWAIEFRRNLKTGHSDDIQFDVTKSYLFAVSRYEVAGRVPNSRLTQPLYGSGDTGESLTLVFGD